MSIAPRSSDATEGLTVESVGCRTLLEPLRAPFRTSLRELTQLEVVEARVIWSDGTESTSYVSPVPQVTGETTASICAAITGPLAEAVKGKRLEDHSQVLSTLEKTMWANPTAKCAIDLALHCAVGARAVGGGGQAVPADQSEGRSSLASLAACLGTPGGRAHTDVTITLASPEQMATQATRRVREGFDVLKLKLGGDVRTDVARTMAVHRAVPADATLRLDANQAWSAYETLAFLDALEDAHVRPELVEQPVPWDDLAGMATVARRSRVPIMADESVRSARDVVRLAEMRAASIINIKLAKVGGLRAAQEVIATAHACGMDVIVGCMMEPLPTVAAAGLLALTLPTRRAHDLDAGWWLAGRGDGTAGDLIGDTDAGYHPPFVVLDPRARPGIGLCELIGPAGANA